MKRLLTFLLTMLCLFMLPACNKADEAKECAFQATVLEVHDTYLLVEPAEGCWERTSADRITISLQVKTPWPTPQVGDTVNIVYNGELLETYPAHISKPYRVEILID